MRTKLTTGPLAALLAFACYGGWAFWVNRPHGLAHANRALLVQGGASFVTTFLLSALVAFFRVRVQTRGAHAIVPALLSTATVSTLLVVTHAIAGTRELLTTIAPSVALGFVYATYCAFQRA